MPNIWMIVIAGVLITVLVGSLTASAYNAGNNKCEAEHAEAANKIKETNRKKDAKIDNSTPYNADRDTKLEWLQQYTRD